MTAERPTAKGGFQVLTGSGPAAIALIRVLGPQTATFIEQHVRLHRLQAPTAWQPGRVWRAELRDANRAALDDILVSVHAAPPHWDVRLHLHGNPWLVRRCSKLLRSCGLRELGAELSSITSPERKRAIREPVDRIRESSADYMTLWAATDALEAEAHALLPQMLTLHGARWLLEQVQRLRAMTAEVLVAQSLDAARAACREAAERGYVFSWFSQPLRIVLTGPPNVGKSTLANALAQRAVSLVSPNPGTTRDWVEIPGEAEGFPLIWLDTAGLRLSTDALEGAGIDRTHRLIREADAVIVVLDATDPAGRATASFLETYGDLAPVCVALNKSDLDSFGDAVRDALPETWRTRTLSVSALAQTGLDALRGELMATLGRTAVDLDLPAAFTQRQATLLKRADAARTRRVFKSIVLQLL